MTELIGNAWLGWKDYTDNGKLAALLLAVLLFLWFGQKKVEKKVFLLYTTIMTVCCIFPLTAAVLMVYQTRFYDYEWIWSMVPLTAAVAWGTVILLMKVWPDLQPAEWRRGVPVTVFSLAVILLCGNLGDMPVDQEKQETDRQQAYKILGMVKEAYPGEELCLWAPREILEYAREADASVKLPYGRDMWDASLGAYSYDVYDGERNAMYHWMEACALLGESDGSVMFEGDGETVQRTGEEAEGSKETLEGNPMGAGSTTELCAGYARNAGVNCILIPDTAAPETVQRLENALGADAHKLEDYWIFYGWTD